MIRHYFEDRPQTVRKGTVVRGLHYLFVNLGVEEIAEEDRTDENRQYKYECYSMRFALSDFSIAGLVSSMPKEFLVLANEEEVMAIMEVFGVFEDIEAWQTIRAAQIEAYDSSFNVNNFRINGIDGWFDKNTRVGLVNMLRSYQSDEEVPELWLDDEHPIALPNAAEGLELMSEIEKYAAKCYSATQRLLVSVRNMGKLEDLEGLKGFDYKSAYPSQLDLTV